ncbi:MAG TPA: carbon-nitrogen hydrolase family protein [Acidobacteriota bacterium]|jgi:predicted amidohydrolase
MKFCIRIFFGILFLSIICLAEDKPQPAVNLLAWDNSSPTGGWTPGAPRDEIAPTMSADTAKRELSVFGKGLKGCAGYWRRTIPGIRAGAVYRFRATVDSKQLVRPAETLQVLVGWKVPDFNWRSTGRNVPEYAAQFRQLSAGSIEVTQLFKAPQGASAADIELWFRWNPDARVAWKDLSLTEAREQPHRKVRIATVYWRNSGPTDLENNLKFFLQKIDQAATARPDIILLPERFKKVGTRLEDAQLAEQIPGGKVFNLLAERARRYKSYVIYGDTLREAPYLYNVAVIIDRKGKLAGIYKKVQLPIDEAMSLTPGDDFPVFDLDFGRAGMLICHDAAFPEPARILGLKGAEVVFVPIWGGDTGTQQTRAAENGLYWVTAGFDIPSMIIAPDKKILSSTWKNQGTGVAFAEIDLDEPIRQDWIGNWRNAVWQQRRPGAYKPLVDK